MATEPTIGILQQRRIEAGFAKGIFEEMATEIGEARAAAIMERAIVKLAEQAGARRRRRNPNPGHRTLRRHPAALDPR